MWTLKRNVISFDIDVFGMPGSAKKTVFRSLPKQLSKPVGGFDSKIGWARRSARRISGRRLSVILWCAVILTFSGTCTLSRGSAQKPSDKTPTEQTAYILGPDDQIVIRVLDVEEIGGNVARVDPQGYIDVPLLGKYLAAGLSVDQLEAQLTKELRRYVHEPQVTVIISEYRSQPVSVLGAVNSPGVYNLTGVNTLVEVLSKAGGLRNDAGNSINITRKRALGTIPLPMAKSDPSGEFSTAEVNLKSLLEAKNPRDNIMIEPTDVISVPRADLVYIVGAVRRPGGFVLNERENMTVLQALSMAEGLEKTSAPKRAKIIRRAMTTSRAEIPVNLVEILSGKSPDVPLFANDILFIPNSGAKSVGYRTIEAVIQVGTGVAIFRP
jgi:polysaccharide export outer membrane protein